MTTSWEQKGIEKTHRKTIVLYATMHFGELSVEQLERIEAWPAERLEELVKRVFQVQSAEEFDRILRTPDADPNGE